MSRKQRRKAEAVAPDASPLPMNGNDIPVPPLCAEPGCHEIGIVGWGMPPEQVCNRHYDERLRFMGDLMRTVFEVWYTGPVASKP